MSRDDHSLLSAARNAPGVATGQAASLGRRARIAVLLLLFLAVWAASAAPPAAIYPNPPHQSSNAPARLTLSWSPGDYELIANGNFETGNFAGWQRTNFSNFGGGINNTYINNGTFRPQSGDGPLPPFAGTNSTVTDENAPGVLTLYQDIMLPATADAITLSWVDQIHNLANTFANTPPLQEFRAEIRSTSNTVLALAYQTESGDPTYNNWVKRSFDLSDYRGQRVRVAFVTEVNLAPFHTHLDNISARVRSRAGFTYGVYFGTNALPGTNEFLGNTTNASWALPPLQPQQTYYWRTITQQDGDQTPGPIWRFTTRPVGALDQFVWSTISAPQSADSPIPVTLTAVDSARNVVTNFNGSVSLSGATLAETSSHSFLGDLSSPVLASYDRATVGYAFTPSIDLQITHWRHYSGEKMSLWTDAGVLLASGAITSQPQTWNETPLLQPVQLLAGHRYRVGVYSGALATNYARFDAPAAFAHGIIHQSYDGLGDAFPANAHPAHWWLLDLRYVVGAPQLVSVTPDNADFTNGVWSGQIAVSTREENLILRADDDLGHVGLIMPFLNADIDTDGDGMPDRWEQMHGLRPDDPDDAALDADADGASNLSEYLAGTDPKDAGNVLRITRVESSNNGVQVWFRSVPGKRYSFERTTNLTGSEWESVGEPLFGDGTVLQAHDPSTGLPQRFYRCRVLP